MRTRLIDRETFEQLTCNRCGQCCERHSGFRGRSPLEAIPCIGPADKRNGRWMDNDVWFGQQVPLGPNEDGVWEYRCPLLAYDGEQAVCTVHDHRPGICYWFPYGSPSRYEGCVWNVELLEDHLPWMPERLAWP